jgi:hypothetical protein
MHKDGSLKQKSQICYGIEYVDGKFILEFCSKYCDAIELFKAPNFRPAFCGHTLQSEEKVSSESRFGERA